ncbi:hypothetical protein CPB86DRAFT_794093 [Serendipita vermifera]|nr:hypothetical protein CPB86DRAFT_794093 [Serendipita vermifera]
MVEWFTCVVSQNDLEPFSIEWQSPIAECEREKVKFHGAIEPYRLYSSVAHAVDNYASWSEESLVFTADSTETFDLLVTPNIGVLITAGSGIPCDDGGSLSSIDQMEEPTAITVKPTLGDPEATSGMGYANVQIGTATRVTAHSEQETSSRPQVSMSVEAPPQETRRNTDPQHTQVGSQYEGAPANNEENTESIPSQGGSSDDRDVNFHPSQNGSQDSAGERDNTSESPSELEGSATPRSPNDYILPVGGNSEGSNPANKSIHLSGQAAGIIGATVQEYPSLGTDTAG